MIKKKGDFLNIVSEFGNLVIESSRVDTFGTFILLYLLMRIILATRAHPRISLVTSTLAYAMSDLFHLIIIFVIVLMCFSTIGMILYASESEIFSSIGMAMSVGFDNMLGPPGNLLLSEAVDVKLLFSFCFHFICFFLMVNFVLAIIVDSYAKVVAGLVDNKVEQDIMSDVWMLCKHRYFKGKHKWPSRLLMAHKLGRTPHKLITAARMKRIGMSESGAKDFVSLYQHIAHPSNQDGTSQLSHIVAATEIITDKVILLSRSNDSILTELAALRTTIAAKSVSV